MWKFPEHTSWVSMLMDTYIYNFSCYAFLFELSFFFDSLFNWDLVLIPNSLILQLMALLLLRHALTATDSDGEDDVSAFFSVSWIGITVYSMVTMIISSSFSVFWILCFHQSDELVDPLQLFLLRAAGFLLPCYIMAWAISILQRRRQRQVSVFPFSFNLLYPICIVCAEACTIIWFNRRQQH
jgi:hypothetical protein